MHFIHAHDNPIWALFDRERIYRNKDGAKLISLMEWEVLKPGLREDVAWASDG